VAVTEEKLDSARNSFKADPQPATAAQFLSVLRECEETGEIDDDTFHNGLADIETYLWSGGSVRPLEKSDGN
jgi:hypothetical protein